MLSRTPWQPAPSDQAIVVDGEEFIAQVIGEEGIADVERRTELFNVVSKDFSCSVGKVGLTCTIFSMQSFNYLRAVSLIDITAVLLLLLTPCLSILCSLKVVESVTSVGSRTSI